MVRAGRPPCSTSDTATIGPNSPTAPAASRNVPRRVATSPLSRKMGSSVPIAVVETANAT